MKDKKPTASARQERRKAIVKAKNKKILSNGKIKVLKNAGVYK